MTPPEVSGDLGRFRKWRRKNLMGTEPLVQPTGPPLPDLSKPTELKKHSEIVATEILRLFDSCDAEVARRIGFKRPSIREELYPRRPIKIHDDVNTQGLDPSLRKYLHPGQFFYRADDRQGYLVELYRINYRLGSFSQK
jgi:hypothetical protein